MLDFHWDNKEHQDASFRKKLVISNKHAHQGTRGSDNGIMGESQNTHGNTEDSRKYSTEEIHEGKMLGTHPFPDLCTEHPEHQHIKEEMHKIYMDKHVGYVAPSLKGCGRQKGSEVEDILLKRAISDTGQVQMQPQHTAHDSRNRKHHSV